MLVRSLWTQVAGYLSRIVAAKGWRPVA